MDSGILSTATRRLYYEDEGAGAAVVFIPGHTLDTCMWDSQAEAFAARHRVIRYDLPGAGRSPPPTGRYRHHDDLKALLDHLGIAKAHIVGLSLGAGIAVDFALACPEATLSLVPVAPSMVSGYPWPSELDALFAPISAAAARGDIAEAKRLWLAADWFAPALKIPACAEALRRIVGDYSGWHFHNKNPVERIKPPATERLEKISAPTLVIAGALDLPYYNLALAETLAQRIPNARKLVIPGVGHMTNMEDPARFNAAVLAFIDDVPS